MGAEVVTVEPTGVWGTWEELVLGGAVLRHGTGDWNVVVSELRARTLNPYTFFTAEACKAKYEDLQKRYSCSMSWFEELRKRRVEELKNELAKSEDSIGSLESKIKSLEANKRPSNHVDYSSSRTESPFLGLNSDEQSAGSFTKDRDLNPGYVTIRKRRGQRKRKDYCAAMNEGSLGESDNLGSCNNIISTVKQTASDNFCQKIRDPALNNHNPCTRRDKVMEIFESIEQHEQAAVFRHRMDSQKRARYRKVIRQHVDISTIRSRIVGQSIKSVKELFRDLLLLSNNALVFYSRRTREYKSAFSLRNLVMKEYKCHCTESFQETGKLTFLHVKPRSARPRHCRDKVPDKLFNAEDLDYANPDGLIKARDFEYSFLEQSVLKDKKGLKRIKVKHGLGTKTSPVKQRKRIGV